MGATFLEVEIQEDGAGAGGYAKVRGFSHTHKSPFVLSSCQ